MEFAWTEEEVAYREQVRALVDERYPTWRATPVHHSFATDERDQVTSFTHELRDRKLLTAHWPQEYGGADQSAWMHIILGEELWSVGEPRGPQYMSVNWIGPAIMANGTEEQKQEHLGRISDGEAFWCQGFSEPDSGSDLASLKCRAVRDGEEYVVNGQKIWTSHTQLAEWCFLLVRTDPEAEPHKGISVLLVPMATPGIEVRSIANVAGESSFAEVFFTDVRVPVANRLGPENGGWDIVRAALTYERVGAPRWHRGSVVLDALVAWAKEHDQFDDPIVQSRLGEAKAAIEAARMLAYRVVDERAHKLPPGPNAYVARVSMVRAEKQVAELALWLMGEQGIDGESLAGHTFYPTLTAGVAGGTYEVQLNLVAGLVLQLPRR
ncbi:MAG: acyl-CoA dehydrogenase family protein [Actinomycetota bacterium]|nr:acyl-CoA dehydrogenase family protein [Actinomycetota bacterium]